MSRVILGEDATGGGARAQAAPYARAANGRRLETMIEGEIIPRLLLAHSTGMERRPPDDGAPAQDAATALDPGLIDDWARIAMGSEAELLHLSARSLVERGVPLDAMFLGLFAPIARRLGEMWEDDLCSFTDVTIGLCRLQQAVQDLSQDEHPGRANTREASGAARRALFAPAPGEQHTFGLVLVDNFFRRAGWATVCDAAATQGDLTDAVKAHSFDVVGFTVGNDKALTELPATIAAVRRASVNPDLVVLVGGRLAAAGESFADRVGADGVVCDAAGACACAEKLMSERAGRRARLND